MKSIQLGEYGTLDVYLTRATGKNSGRKNPSEAMIAVRRDPKRNCPTYAALLTPEEKLTRAQLKRWLLRHCAAVDPLKSAIGYLLFVFEHTYNPRDVAIFMRQPQGFLEVGVEIDMKTLGTSRQRLRLAQRHLAEISLLLQLLTERRPMFTARMIDL